MKKLPLLMVMCSLFVVSSLSVAEARGHRGGGAGKAAHGGGAGKLNRASGHATRSGGGNGGGGHVNFI
jgi:hypothetical protein